MENIKRHTSLLLIITSIILFAAGAKAYAGEALVIKAVKTQNAQSSAAVNRGAGHENSTVDIINAQDKTDAELVAELRKSGQYIAVSENHKRRLLAAAPNDTHYSEQWALQNIGAEKFWNASSVTGNAEIVVAILDTGINAAHEDLKDNLWASAEVCGRKFTGGKSEDLLLDVNSDINGHGTAVAGIIGAVGNNGIGISGILWKVKILPVAIFTQNSGGEPQALDSDIIAGIDYLLDLKAHGTNIKVVNLSFGEWTPVEKEATPLALKIKELSDAGIIVTIAAGNDYEDLDEPSGTKIGYMLYPAAYKFDNTITVGSIKKDGKKSGWSNYSSKGEVVDIFAPGEDILSTAFTGYLSNNGTSFASPQVAGAAALLMALEPNNGAKAIKDELQRLAADKLKKGYSKIGTLRLVNDEIPPTEEERQTTSSSSGCNAGTFDIAVILIAGGLLGILYNAREARGKQRHSKM